MSIAVGPFRATVVDGATSPPSVTIVIPCRNERAFIARCVESILASDYPAERLEVLIVDGMSDDGTREIVHGFVSRHHHVRMFDNPGRITPVALNIGVRQARGDVIMLMSAHATMSASYISKLTDWLARSGADVVGGVVITRPGSRGVKARAIAAVVSHPFGVGNSHFRIGVKEPRWVDTVPFGCYRRDVFDRIGLFDEDLVRNQDDDLNQRLLKQGGRLLLVPDVESEYYARDSWSRLWRNYFQYGHFKPLVIRKVGAVLTWRQLVPASFVLALVLSTAGAILVPAIRPLALLVAGSYLLADLAAGILVWRRSGVAVGAMSVLTFPIVHLAYGAGFLRGLLEFLVLRRSPSQPLAVPLSR